MATVLDMTMSRYEFLAKAHEIVRPRVYLEVGVQTGASLVLAEDAKLAIGIDPAPGVQANFVRDNQAVITSTSEDYFNRVATSGGTGPIDLAFIDGSHLFEDALRDFIHIERYLAGPRAVVLFDDVLPYNQAIAAREQPPGDWTGDVWKVVEILESQRGDLKLTLVDVAPTGLLMVMCEDWAGVPAAEVTSGLESDYDKIVASWLKAEVVPDHYINRAEAASPEWALDLLRKELA